MRRGLTRWDEKSADGMVGLTAVCKNGDIHDKDLSRENTLLLAFNGRIFLKTVLPRTLAVAGCCRVVDRDSFKVRPTPQRDQTSICGNSWEPSTKIELKLSGRPGNRHKGTSGGVLRRAVPKGQERPENR